MEITILIGMLSFHSGSYNEKKHVYLKNIYIKYSNEMTLWKAM